eukprot:10977520-Lingulodinium_polyedra.AAC.1
MLAFAGWPCSACWPSTATGTPLYFRELVLESLCLAHVLKPLLADGNLTIRQDALGLVPIVRLTCL